MQQQQQKGTDIVVQGRIVWGGVKSGIKKVYGTQTPQIDPKTGKQIIEWAFGLAVPKPSPQSNQNEVQNFQTIWNAICGEASKLGYQQPGSQGFAWKYDDGDGRKPDGSEYPQHSKGCIVIACKTRIPLKLFAWQADPKDGQVKCMPTTEDQIKCGDYVQVSINIDGHGNPNAGLYINPSFVARFAFGEAIINAPDASTVFGNQAPPVPFGGSATPMGGGQLQVPGMVPQMQGQGFPLHNAPAGANQPAPTYPNNGPGQHQQGFNGAPNMGAPNGQQPQTYQPNHGVLPGQFQPQAQFNGGGMAQQIPGSVPQTQGQQMMGNGANAGMNGYGQQPPGNQTQGMPQVGNGPTVQTNAYPSNGGNQQYPGMYQQQFGNDGR